MPTLKASQHGLARIKQARKEKGWTVYDCQWLEAASQVLGVSWEESGVFANGISEGTWKRFLAGKQPINCDAFKAYCQVLGLDWQEVVERIAPEEPASFQDWGEAMDVSPFFGRDTELKILEQWLSPISENNCRFIVLLGMGGIGKTAISIKIARQLQTEFKFIIWRSFRNAPTVEETIVDLIQFLSQQQETNLLETLDGKISCLLYYLRKSRCLLILDNAESILKSGDRSGNYKEGYQGYGQLIRSLGESQHQSCVILTSREKPKGIAAREGETLPVRCLQLTGLSAIEVREIFQSKGQFVGTKAEWKMLIDRYSGNPLALKIVASSIRDFFEGKLSAFLDVLKQGSFLFDDIRDLLSQQFNRLTDLEKQIMYWLAIDREPVTFRELQADFFQKASMNEILQSLVALQQRSLVEKSGDYFTQQPVVMEYVTKEFIERICEEITLKETSLLQSYAWIKATAKDYIRDAQILLILQPIIEQLLTITGSQKNLEYTLKQILEQLKSRSLPETGYVAGNILNLLRQLKVNVTGWNFSHLAVWQAYLQGMNLHNVDFSYADLSRSIFTETLGNVLCVAFSPDGKILATGDTDCRIRLWDSQTGQLRGICSGHQHWVRSIAFSPDGRFLASGSADKTVRLWDANTYELIRIHTEHENEVYTVNFNNRGNMLASGSADKTVRIWNVLRGKCSKVLTGHTHWIRSVSFSLDEKILASGSADRTVRLWDVKTGECLNILIGHSHWVRSIAFTPDDKTLITGSIDKTIKYWDVKTGNCQRTDIGHEGGIYSIALSPDGQILASGSGDKTIRFWDVDTGEIIKTFHGKTDQVLAIAFSSDDRTFACVSQNQIVTLWHWQIDRCFRTLHGHTDWAFPVAFHPKDNLLASGSSDRTVKIWDIATSKLLYSLSGHSDQIMSVAFSGDGEIMASASADRTVRLWDIQTGLCFLVLPGHTDWVDSISFSSDARILASGSGDATIRLWDVETGECLHILAEHTDQVYSVTYRLDLDEQTPILASGSADRTAKIWNSETGECLRTFSGHQSRIYAVAFNRNGDLLASASADATIKIWDVESGRCLQTLTEHQNWVYSVIFCGDSNLLASASADRTVRLWDVKTGECLHVCTGHTHQLCAVASSPDGSQFASGSQDQTVRIWNAKTGKCMKTLIAPRLYEGMKISSAKGLTAAQVITLKALGAIGFRAN